MKILNKEKLRTAIYGFAIGDALGVPYEFKKRGTFIATDMVGYGTHNQPAGTWSDDTSMTLATLDSLNQCDSIDIDDMRNRFENWLFNCEYTVDNKVFDVGNTTIKALRAGTGMYDFNDNGNGSLMRMLPLAFVECNARTIDAVSSITHGNSISADACSEYVAVAKSLLKGYDISDVTKRQFDSIDDVKSTGFVVDSLNATFWSLQTTNSYEEAVLKAVNLGDDTDTIGALTGGLAGIMYGIENIPTEWIKKLRGKEIIDKYLFVPKF